MSPPARARSQTFSKPLTREKIAAAAIEIVRQEGQAAISMRKVAGLFGVDVAALYRHFRNKDALLAEVGRLASEVVELEASTTGTWEQRFLELGEDIRDRLVRHPELGIYGGGSPLATPFIARANALIAALFVEEGLSGRPLVYATQAVLHLVTSIAQSQVMARETPRERNREFAEGIYAQLSEEVQAAWPQTTSENQWSVDFDEFFQFSLKATLNAVANRSAESG